MAISDKTRKTLWARSGNRCAICRLELVSEQDSQNRSLNLGEECHIISSKPNGPRNDLNYGKDFDAYENLILLCCNDHKTIDEQTYKYPADLLRKMKLQHENWVKETIDTAKSPIKEESGSDAKKLSIADKVANANKKIKNKQQREQILNSNEGFNFATQEFENVIAELERHVKEVKDQTPEWHLNLRPNPKVIGSDVMSYGYFLTIQFYPPSYSPDDAYMVIALIKGIFDRDGYADPFTKNESVGTTRVRFEINESDDYGWLLIRGKLYHI